MKPTLVILPGWGGTRETWQSFVDLAKQDFDVEVINLPCFGDEPCPDTAWGIEEYVEFVKNKLSNCHPCEGRDPEKNDKVILLGHSFGGQIATVFASKYPEMIDKLILTAPAVFRPKKTFRRFIFNIGAKLGKLIFKMPWIEKGSLWAEEIYHKVIGAQDYHDTSGIKREIFKNIIRQDQAEAAGKISAPTLIIWGTLDGYLPVSDAYKLNKLIPNSKLEIIKNGRHGLHLQQPKQLLSLIQNFLS